VARGDRLSRFWILVLGLPLAALSCGSGAPDASPKPEPPVVVGQLAADTSRTNTARATYYAAEAARYREIAAQQRALSVAYARWTPPATATKNWNATLKASADARAASADQVAAGLQRVADFHTAEAAKEVAR